MTTADAALPVVAHLEATLGLSFRGARRERMLATIEAERAASGLTPREFLAAVKGSGRTFDRVVAEVTVGETYFFRDRAQCELLRTLVLPQLAEATALRHRLSFWSAGCASGEEAVTLAALAAEAGLGARCEVVGSDASGPAIAKARDAVYGRWSMRSITPEELAAHFRTDGTRFHVADHVRQRTRFVQRNLLDGPPPPGRFALVLCRNLLIYLTPAAVQKVAEILAAALEPDGWLITAAGDPPLEADGLMPVRTRSGLVYRRATGARRPATSARASCPAVRPSARPAAQRAATAPPPAPPPAAAGAPARELGRQVRALGDTGRLADACRVVTAAVQEHPLDVELRYLCGAVLFEAGRLDEAADAAAATVYLDPRAAAAHVLLGQIEHARGNAARARRSFRNGLRLLATVADEAPVALAGDVPAGHLASVATRYLSAHGAVR